MIIKPLSNGEFEVQEQIQVKRRCPIIGVAYCKGWSDTDHFREKQEDLVVAVKELSDFFENQNDV